MHHSSVLCSSGHICCPDSYLFPAIGATNTDKGSDCMTGRSEANTYLFQYQCFLKTYGQSSIGTPLVSGNKRYTDRVIRNTQHANRTNTPHCTAKRPLIAYAQPLLFKPFQLDTCTFINSSGLSKHFESMLARERLRCAPSVHIAC